MLIKAFKKIQYIYESKYNREGLAKKLGVTVGNKCRFIDFPQFGSEPYLIEIGDRVTISSEVLFLTHDGGTWVFRDVEKYRKVIKFGKIKIGNNCFIGARSTIMPGVVIGDNCVIGACSLVTQNVPSGEVWGGVPAHFITKTNDYAEKLLKNNPVYDYDNFTKNKKEELLRILN